MKHITFDTFQEFRCLHCQAMVHIDHRFTGVQHRNHCPYCLWSRHLDWIEAGDRMSACKGGMRPIGLTLKATRNKYRINSGELMLVHRCQDCDRVSLNRVAADDDSSTILRVFHESIRLQREAMNHLSAQGVLLLHADDSMLVSERLYGVLCNNRKQLYVL